MYRQGKDGVIVREVNIDIGRGGDAIEIVQITDVHLNKLSVRDIHEN